MQLPVKVVIVTTFARPGFLRRALDAGVLGLPAQGRAGRGSRRGGAQGACAAAARSIRNWRWKRGPKPIRSNDRERQVLRLAGEGMSAGDIAAQLNLSHGTVRNYLSEAIGKLGVGNRIEAYRLARQKGWL